MSDINQIIQTTITRTSASASLPGFGVPAVFNQFAAGSKGFAASGNGSRTKVYTSTAALLTDGWATTDSVYQWAASLLAQNPRVPKFLVGRIDSGDASVAASGDAIRAESDDFYTIEVVGNRSIVFTLSTGLITGNSIASTINGTTVTTTVFATDHATTMNTWKTNIQSAIAGSTATVSGNTMTVTLVGKDMTVGTCVITLGASQPAVAITYPLDATKSKAWMVWTEAQKKLLFLQDADPAQYAADTGVSGTACLGEYAKLLGYERTVVSYHADSTQYLTAAWVGDQLPYDPGVNTWAFKNLTGISGDLLTTSQESYIRGKNINVYTPTAAVNITYAGTCAKASRYIDDQRFLDWVDTTIKLDLANLLFQAGKVPFTDTGIQMVKNTVKAALEKGVTKGGWTPGSISVTAPKAADVSPANKASRTLPDVNWSAQLAGAVHMILVNGTVAV